MKICAISDSHRRQLPLPHADLLIHAGDLGGRGSSDELLDGLDWLISMKGQFPKGILYVPGNHDRAMDKDLYEKRWLAWERNPYHTYKPTAEVGPGNVLKKFEEAGIQVLIDQAIEIEGLKIYGTPYTPIFMDWAFMEPESRLAKRYSDIPNDIKILVSHGPASGLRDLCSNGHVGSHALREVLDERLPDLKAHIFGHIHEGAGWHQEGRFVSWNASVLDGNYEGFNEVFVLDTEDWKMKE